MSEVVSHEAPETPASSSIARVRLLAKLVGEQTRDELRSVLDSLEFRIGSLDWAPHDAGRKAEAEILHAHALIDDAEVKKRSIPTDGKGIGRGLVITI